MLTSKTITEIIKKHYIFYLRDLFQVGLDNIDITYDTVM